GPASTVAGPTGPTGYTGPTGPGAGAAGQVSGTPGDGINPTWTSPPISITKERSGKVLLNGFASGQSVTNANITLTVKRDAVTVGFWQAPLTQGPGYYFQMPFSMLDALPDSAAHLYTLVLASSLGQISAAGSYEMTA